MREVGPVFVSVLTILGLFAVGNLLRRSAFIGNQTVQDLKKLVVKLALPCLLFLVFLRLRVEARLAYLFVTVCGLCAFTFLSGKLLSRVIKGNSPYFPFLLTGFESGMVGYAIFLSAYGMENVETFASVDIGQILFVWFVLITPLLRLRGERTSPSGVIRMFATSPVVIAIFAGLAAGVLTRLFRWTENPVYSFAVSLVTMIGNLTVPLICLTIGYEFKVERRALRLSLMTIALRLALTTGAGALISALVFTRLLHLDSMYTKALMVMCILPPPFVYTLFVPPEDAGGRLYLSSTYSLHTIVSLLASLLVISVL